MNRNEQEIEKWISLTQEGFDELCTQMRGLAQSDPIPDGFALRVINLLLVHQLQAANAAAVLLNAVGVKIPSILPK